VTGIPRKSLKVVGVASTIGTLVLVLVVTLPLTPQPGSCACPLGPGFAAGNPVAGLCASASTFATSGCLAGDFTYHLTIESSSVTFGSVLFTVTALNGTVLTATGGAPGFSILSPNGSPAAEYLASSGAMSMTTGWTYASGTNASTPLTSLYSILIDMGTLNPAHRGYSFAVECRSPCSASGFLTLP
jgi:hypothetical protein